MTASLRDRGHEVCITSPARQHVDVNVVRNSGACSSSEIHAHIETRR